MHTLPLLLTIVQSGAPTPVTNLESAAWRFVDYDADGLLDAYLLRPREGDCLLRNLGDGRFVDVTAQTGLSGLTETRSAVWHDLDGDGYRSVTFRGFEAVVVEAMRELRQEQDRHIAALEARLARAEGR